MPDGHKISRAEQIERCQAGIKTSEKKSDDDSDETVISLDEPDIKLQELQEIPMPEIEDGSEYLVAFLHSAGTASATGMGLTGLSWQEIKAWVECTNMHGIVTPRDLSTIYTLSRAYVGEYTRASEKGAKPPYVPVIEVEVDPEEFRDSVADKAEQLFLAMISNQNKKK